MSKHNPYILYTTQDFYEEDKIGDTPQDLYNRSVYSIIGMYEKIDDALDMLNALNKENADQTHLYVWKIERQSVFKKRLLSK